MQPLKATHLFTFGLPTSPITLSLENLILKYLEQASQSVHAATDDSFLSPWTCSASPQDAAALLTEMGDYLTRTAMIWASLIENLIKGPHIDHVTLQILEHSRAKTRVADLSAAASLDVTLGRLRHMEGRQSKEDQCILLKRPPYVLLVTQRDPIGGPIGSFIGISPYARGAWYGLARVQTSPAASRYRSVDARGCSNVWKTSSGITSTTAVAATLTSGFIARIAADTTCTATGAVTTSTTSTTTTSTTTSTSTSTTASASAAARSSTSSSTSISGKGSTRSGSIGEIGIQQKADTSNASTEKANTKKANTQKTNAKKGSVKACENINANSSSISAAAASSCSTFTITSSAAAAASTGGSNNIGNANSSDF
ncbi:hypothetical protein ACHAQJ_000019 [Trichoderma viride]